MKSVILGAEKIWGWEDGKSAVQRKCWVLLLRELSVLLKAKGLPKLLWGGAGNLVCSPVMCAVGLLASEAALCEKAHQWLKCLSLCKKKKKQD